MDQPERYDLAKMSERELAWWRVMVDNMTHMQRYLAAIAGSFYPGRIQPDPELQAIAAELQAELARRSAGKWNEYEHK